MIKNRLAKLRAKMKKEKLDGFLVNQLENMWYLSGFSFDDSEYNESSSYFFITSNNTIFFTDFRYKLNGYDQVFFFTPYICCRNLIAEIAVIIQTFKLRRLGFEVEAMFVDQYNYLDKMLVNVELVPTRGFILGLRQCKWSNEIRILCKSLTIIEVILAELLTNNLIGMSERELAQNISQRALEVGAEADAFKPIVASGPNAAKPHVEPSERILIPGDPVIFDVGVKFRGYSSDISRTIIVGDVANKNDDFFLKIYSIVRQAQLKAIAGIKPGMSGIEGDSIARQVIEKANYGKYFNHSLGHGIGLATHELPVLSPYSQDILGLGMVFTIEPGIYLPGWGGVRLEQTVVLADNGCQLLNSLNDFYEF